MRAVLPHSVLKNAQICLMRQKQNWLFELTLLALHMFEKQLYAFCAFPLCMFTRLQIKIQAVADFVGFPRCPQVGDFLLTKGNSGYSPVSKEWDLPYPFGLEHRILP